jgi:hypothetical protein
MFQFNIVLIGRPRTRWMELIRKDIKMRGEKLQRNTRKRKWQNGDGGHLSIIVDPYLWKRYLLYGTTALEEL